MCTINIFIYELRLFGNLGGKGHGKIRITVISLEREPPVTASHLGPGLSYIVCLHPTVNKALGYTVCLYHRVWDFTLGLLTHVHFEWI